MSEINVRYSAGIQQTLNRNLAVIQQIIFDIHSADTLLILNAKTVFSAPTCSDTCTNSYKEMMTATELTELILLTFLY